MANASSPVSYSLLYLWSLPEGVVGQSETMLALYHEALQLKFCQILFEAWRICEVI